MSFHIDNYNTIYACKYSGNHYVKSNILRITKMFQNVNMRKILKLTPHFNFEEYVDIIFELFYYIQSQARKQYQYSKDI